MMLRSLFFIALIALPAFLAQFAHAVDVIEIDAQSLRPRVSVAFSPRAASFTEGSTFEVPIYIDTNGASINSMELEVRFDPRELLVVNPSGGRSIIGVWIEPPSYDNTRGTVRFVGTVPGGITAESGLIATITFRARALGDAALSFSEGSQVLLNDGYGTRAQTEFGRANYTISAKPPEGIAVYSSTHPSSDTWYNNNSPSFSWDATGADAVSFVLDSAPNTVPPSEPKEDTGEASFENVPDGISYFHLKTRKGAAWGNTTHFAVKIDTTPPAEFEPQIDYIAAAAAAYHGLISFKTTDALSDITHYEVGVIDLANESASPVFIQTESPYRVPSEAARSRVIVRAFDAAGNTRDASIDVDTASWAALIVRNLTTLGLFALLIGLLALIGVHYLVRHHVMRHVRDAYSLFRREQAEETHDAPPPPPQPPLA